MGRARFSLWCAAAIVTSPLATSPILAQTEEISQRYDAYCSVCHGDSGQGALHAQQGMMPPPKDFTDPAFARTMTRDRMIAVIRNGKPGTAMIAWKAEINEQEIAQIADYIIGNFLVPAATGNTAERPAQDLQEAITIYQESCSVCHGDDGTGAVWGQVSLATAPRNFTTELSRRELTRDRMIASVTYGRPGSPMPGFGTQLSTAQVEAIVDYVRARFMTATPDTAVHGSSALARSNPVASSEYHKLPYPDGLSGQFERGRAFYMANCVTCHGMDGGGDGPRAYFIFPRPRSFTEPATQQILNRPALFRGIKDGVLRREMPAWGKVMDDQDIADIAEYVYLQFIKPVAAGE